MMSSGGLPEGFGQVIMVSNATNIAETCVMDGIVEDAAGIWEVTLGYFEESDWQKHGWKAKVVYILGLEFFEDKEEAFEYRRALRDAWDLPKFPKKCT